MLQAFLSAWCYAIYLHLKIAVGIPALTRSTIMSISGLIVVSFVYPPLYLFNGRLLDLGVWPLVSGVLNQVFPTLLLAIGIPIIGGVLSGILGAIELPVSVLSSNLILHEPISPTKWLGIAFILIGIAVASTLGDRKARELRTESSAHRAKFD